MFQRLLFLLLAGSAWTRVQDLTRVPGTSGSEVVQEVVSRIGELSVFRNVDLGRLAYEKSHNGNDPETYRSGYDGGIWQIDRNQFQQMKKSRKATDLFEVIKSKFAIDWNTVQWSDLRKPLYSGLAAALFLATITEEVQQLTENQGSYLRKEVQNRFQRSISFLEEPAEKTFSIVFHPPDIPNVCTSGLPHFQAHPQDATKFFLCRNGQAFYMFQCVPRRIYDPSSHTCVPQKISQVATWLSVLPTDGTVPPKHHQTLPSEVPVPTRLHVPHQYRDVNPCTNAESNNMYYFPHPTDKHKYIQCDPFGDAFTKTCPENKIWHQVVLQCILDGLFPDGTITG